MNTRLVVFCLGLSLLDVLRSSASAPIPTYVRFNTVLGNIDVELLSNDAPKNVANFLTYVDGGAYTNSFIHRSVPGFIFQGGGYYILNDTFTAIPENAPVVNEFKVSNTRGTLAMAKLGSGPNTATNEWFFNEVDNSANLDNQNGGFTVFGKIASTAGLAVMDKIEGVPVPYPGPFASPFDQIPLIDYNASAGVMLDNLVIVNSITRLTQTFAAWESAYFTTTQLGEATVSGATAMPENDGVPNLLKYLYGIDPAVKMAAADRAALPVFGTDTTTTPGTTYLTLTYRQYMQLTGVTVVAQTSPDLKTWTTVTPASWAQTGTDSDTGDPIMKVEIKETTAAKQFVRLRVTSGTTSVDTVPVGVLIYSLPATGATAGVSYLSFPLTDGVVYAGEIGSYSANVVGITDTTNHWVSGAFATAATPYFVKFTSGAEAGRVVKITSNSTRSVTLDTTDHSSQTVSLTTTGFSVKAGDGFQIFAGDTLATLFGTGTTAAPLLLKGGTSATAADTVGIYNVATAKWQLYYFNTASKVWLLSGSTVNANNTVIYPYSAVQITRLPKEAADSFTLTGRVTEVAPLTKTIGGGVSIYYSTGYACDVMLSQLKFGPNWLEGSPTASVDNVLVWNPTTARWNTYSEPNATSWIEQGVPTTNQNGVVVHAGSGIGLVQRKTVSGATSFLRSVLPYTPN